MECGLVGASFAKTRMCVHPIEASGCAEQREIG
jgi:hypothetical protein